MKDVPTFDELMWPALLALKATGGSASNEELLNKIIDIERIPDAIASIAHKDNRQSKLNYNLAWAKTYLKKVDAITNSQRGVWSITEYGEALTADEVDAIPALVRKGAYDNRKSRPKSEVEELNDESSDADSAVASWRDDLLEAMRKLDPSAFERLAQRLLREAGFIKVEVTGRSGDGGIDGVGILRLKLLSFTTLFQCKRYLGTVGSGAVRDFRGAMVGRSDKGLIITTGTFSADARREATRDGAPAIELIDGDQLCDLMRELKIGLKTEVVERIVIDHVWLQQL